VETGVQTTKHVQHLIPVGDRLAEVSEAVGVVLEASEVVDDGPGALLDAAELSGEEDGLMLTILHE
jgi:hypothetical protein